MFSVFAQWRIAMELLAPHGPGRNNDDRLLAWVHIGQTTIDAQKKMRP